MAAVFLVVFAFLLLLLLAWYRYLYGPFQVLKRLGIPHPPITPFIGNVIERNLYGTYAHENWIKAYGKVVGFYIGAEVRVIIADVDMLKEITVKQFDIFTDRVFKASPLVEGARKVAPGLFDGVGQSWKKRRTSLTPSFSSKKLKMMSPLIEKNISSLCERISELSVNNSSIEFHKLYSSFTMETILANAFGTKVDLIKGERNALSEAADGAFKIIGPTLLWSICLQSHFPLLLRGLVKLVGRYSAPGAAYSKLVELATIIVKARREQLTPPQEKDFLQVLLESGQNEEKSYQLTDPDIVGTCIEFILASHDTTTNCLSYTSYLLALNPDKQDKLRQHIQDYYQENEEASLYEAAHSIPYLEWVINESMRRYAPATRTMRYCKQTCTINGVTIPEGCLVVVPIQYIHHCPDYWEEPYAFKPERFSPEEKEGRDPLLFMPFGWGPRSCIGARFALMELKMTLLSILRNYKFERAPETEIPLKTKTFLTQSPVNGVYLKVSKC